VNIYKYLLKQFNFLHDFSSSGSEGQAECLFFHLNRPLVNINEPETENNRMLYFSIKSNFGKVEKNDANIGPPPSNSNNAGKAQQMHILILVTKLAAVTASALFGLVLEFIVFI
jgi:hypothetical protein